MIRRKILMGELRRQISIEVPFDLSMLNVGAHLSFDCRSDLFVLSNFRFIQRKILPKYKVP